MRFFLSIPMKFNTFSNSFIRKNERITFDGAKFKMKVDLKEITERYRGEVYQGICSCVEWRSITGASVGIQCTGGFADMSGGKS